MKIPVTGLAAAFYVLYLLIGVNLNAQPTETVDETTARENLESHTDPIYPPIALAAHVQGTVALGLVIDETGRVAQVKTISGPPMLVGSARDAVGRWKFKPFQKDSQSVVVSTTITIPFGDSIDADDSKAYRTFQPVWNKCNSLISQKGLPADQADTCKQAADQADQLKSVNSLVARRSAYVFCAMAFMHNHDPVNALPCATKAVAVVSLGHDDASGTSNAYMVRAQAEVELNKLTAADDDLTIAEKAERAALATPTSEELARGNRYGLKVLLTFHSQVYTSMGEQAKSDDCLQEASKL